MWPSTAHAAPGPGLEDAVRMGLAVHWNQTVAWNHASVAVRRNPAPAGRPVSRGTPATVGECSGFVIPGYIIQRESGGNPNAYNSSGAYGCAQTLLSHYSGGGACAGQNPGTIEGQRECVRILSSDGTDLSPWAQTR